MYDQVRFYCLKGNTHTLVWCRDALSNWHTELIGNQLPDSRTVKLPLQFLSNKVSDVEQYDPWSDVRKVAHVVMILWISLSDVRLYCVLIMKIIDFIWNLCLIAK